MTSNATKQPDAKPEAPKRKWRTRSFFKVAVVGGIIAIATALALSRCGRKQVQEQKKQETVQMCCPEGFKEVERGKNNKNEFIIRCAPIQEPIICNKNKTCESPPENVQNCPDDCLPVCGDGFVTHKEECDTKSSKANQGCKDDKKECKNVKNSCKCVEKKRPIKCKDGICDKPQENAKNCPEDCTECGDKICTTPKENAQNCPQDCPPKCGDGLISPPNEECDPKSDQANKGCAEGKTCTSKCKCEEKKEECTDGNATTINAPEDKLPYRRILRAMHEGVMNLTGKLSGSTVTVTILVCPPGNKAGSAKLLDVKGAGQYESEVKDSIRQLLSRTRADQEITAPRRFREEVIVP